MKTFVVLLLVTLAVTQVLSFDPEKEWQDFKAKYNKSYPDPKEDAMRKAIFLDKLQKINEHNAKYEKGEVSFKLAVNKFTDYTEEEIRDLIVG